MFIAFHTFKVEFPNEIYFNKQVNHFILKGLSNSEAWGRWSNSPEIEIIPKYELPDNTKISISLYGFGPNIDKTVLIKCGSKENEIKISSLMKKYDLNCSEDYSIKIDVPTPISPKELGIGDDDRKIGIGIEKINLSKSSNL